MEQYEAVAGDTWDSIAFDFYTDEKMASVLIQANTKYADTLLFEGGEVLMIPVLEDSETPASAPPWRA